jgi:hypothetical protein
LPAWRAKKAHWRTRRVLAWLFRVLEREFESDAEATRYMLHFRMDQVAKPHLVLVVLSEH